MTMKREKIHLGILRTGEYITLTWVDNRFACETCKRSTTLLPPNSFWCRIFHKSVVSDMICLRHERISENDGVH